MCSECHSTSLPDVTGRELLRLHLYNADLFVLSLIKCIRKYC